MFAETLPLAGLDRPVCLVGGVQCGDDPFDRREDLVVGGLDERPDLCLVRVEGRVDGGDERLRPEAFGVGLGLGKGSRRDSAPLVADLVSASIGWGDV